MAKSAYSIMIDYQKAIKQAETLENIAKSIMTYGRKVTTCKDSISSVWKGESPTQYLVKLGIVSDNLEIVTKNIINTADTIRRIAKRTYDTEMASLELAKKRTYK